MRGARLSVFVFTLVLVGCTAANPFPTDPKEPAQKPRPRSEQLTSVAPAPPAPPALPSPLPVLLSPASKMVTTPTSASPEPLPAAPPEVEIPLVVLQKRRLECNPGDDEERLRMALLHAADGDFEEADLALSSVRSHGNPIVPHLNYFLRTKLGDHAEASQKMLFGKP